MKDDDMTIDKRRYAGLARAAAIGFLVFAAVTAHAASRTQLQEQRFPAPRYHTVTVKAVVDAGGQVPPHTHPGIEMGYVVEGQAVLNIAGQPPRTLTTGDSFAVPPIAVHGIHNAGKGPLTLVSTYVVEVGKPILTLVH
jgi:quercetin dioxygenase-like cupin family protein